MYARNKKKLFHTGLFYLYLSINFIDQKDMCVRAYFFLRCIIIWNLIYDDAK